MPPGIAARDERILANCREGFLLALREPSYRTTVLDRLACELTTPPEDLWTAVPWIWAVALGAEPPSSGDQAAAVRDVAATLANGLRTGASGAELRASFGRVCADRFDLGVTLRSHPFADLMAWSLRTSLGV